MQIRRSILPHAQFALRQYRALCITGPRQSGKTTLARELFKDKPYVNFEHPGTQSAFDADPDGFIESYKSGAVFDEAQRVPLLFRYLQPVLDRNTRRGQFILTGSNNFLLQENISQTLAGRAGYLNLLPLSLEELQTAEKMKRLPADHIFRGGYPELWDQGIDPGSWMKSYVQTYVERDVRQLKNISNLSAFNRFLHLCAGYAGQLLNRDELAKMTGVDNKTIQSWIGVLESSYIVFLLQPWHKNLQKRTIKSPKLYFCDTGLLCSLLGLSSSRAVQQYQGYGALFENWVMAEIRKNMFNRGGLESMHFLRDSAGNEIDLILEKDGEPLAIEIKSSATEANRIPRSLLYWQKHFPDKTGLLIHGGSSSHEFSTAMGSIGWKEVGEV